MALKIVWTDEANVGLEEIIEYLEREWTEKEVGISFKRLEECLDKIKEAPHRQKNSLRKLGTKEFQHSPQTTIFYSYDLMLRKPPLCHSRQLAGMTVFILFCRA